jgi:hypothetical protein
MSRPRKYPKELIDRGVRLAIESGHPVAHVAWDIGLLSETAAQGGASCGEPIRGCGPTWRSLRRSRGFSGRVGCRSPVGVIVFADA